ncbi:Uncharacterized OsmC-related protein [Pseudonocardia thermophila]|jgi:Predicted redox protein, regulator of disulfide bond formation|uniref:Uncharacterized OsmC-related protein n=1 Tax=Pseudonocardia thermophila TaxID=1848 RepID=A0A1M6VSJ9_PSETH|nr:OsmC family protein [Pseudonocardia thermophila]SHK84354.1 Uncharacterized OsmC-related protein [Pseudonocardia thermophila]
MSSAAPTRDEALRAIVSATTTAVTDDPAKGHVVFRVNGTGGEGVRTHVRINGHSLLVDEPPALGGEDAAPNPVETALAGLLSCQVVTYRFWAAELGIPLDDITIDVEGDLDVRGFFGADDSVRPGFGEVRVVVTLSGPAGEERYRELAATVDAHCPVLDLFRNPTPVTTTLRVA